MTREQAIAIARAAAQKHPESYVTLRAEDFQPHEWVIAAILATAEQARRPLIEERATHLNRLAELLPLLGEEFESSNVEDELDRALAATRKLAAEAVGLRVQHGTMAMGLEHMTAAFDRTKPLRDACSNLLKVVSSGLVLPGGLHALAKLLRGDGYGPLADAIVEVVAHTPGPSFAKVDTARGPHLLHPCGCAIDTHGPEQNHTSSPGFRVCALGWPIR